VAEDEIVLDEFDRLDEDELRRGMEEIDSRRL